MRSSSSTAARKTWMGMVHRDPSIGEELESKSIVVLGSDKPDYPNKLKESLGKAAPPLLFALGNLEILSLCSVAIVGSRHASAKGLDITSKLATLLAREGFNVISGYAKGVDTTAHEAAARHGKTTIVLPFGILLYKPKLSLRPLLNQGNSVVLSEFKPRQRWLAHAAMQRNKTICGLSDAVIVVEARLGGGTLDEGMEALRQRKPLFVIQYIDPPATAQGNESLIEKGGVPLSNWRQAIAIAKDLKSNRKPRLLKKADWDIGPRELEFD